MCYGRAIINNRFVINIFGCLFYNRIFAVTFDEDFARSQGMPVELVSYVMAVVVALAIVLSIKVMGIILLISLMTIPAVIANSLTKDYRYVTLLATLFGVFGNIAGFVLSYNFNLPTGSCIIFTLVLMLIGVKLLTLWHRRATTL